MNMNESLDALLAGFLIVILVFLAFSIVIAVITAVCRWVLFARAGEPGWASLIPIYNLFVQSKISFGDYRWAIAWVAVYVLYMAVMMMQNFIVLGGDSVVIAMMQLLAALLGMVIGIAMSVIGGINTFFFAKAFGKSTAFCVLSIFFSPIMLIIMAIDKNNSQYVGYSDFGQEWFDRIKAKF